MSQHTRLQDSFLMVLHRDQLDVSIFLVNGIKLHGVIADFDENIIFLKNGITQMIYKHAISTVVPAQPLVLPL